MASPISFGDAVAIAKIAYRIAHAFTQGSKSAPAEFREVENQLYSLSTALSALQDDNKNNNNNNKNAITDGTTPTGSSSTDTTPIDPSLAVILENCAETLKHLEKIVEKYGVVAPKGKSCNNSDGSAKSRFQKWSGELVKNYRKIAWTTEAGDLAALRSQLLVHTNSLNLVLGTILSSRTTRIEDNLKENSAMLHDIHVWWAQNLKDATVKGSASPDPASETAEVEEESSAVFFEVHGTSQLLCPRARVHDEWKEPGVTQLFVCACRSERHQGVEDLALSSLSFPIRRPGEISSWTLFKVLDKRTSQMVPVEIRNVKVADIALFEESFIQPLTDARARVMLQQGVSNQLAHLFADAAYIHAINLHSDLTGLGKSVDAVTFCVNHRKLRKDNVEGLQLLSYRQLSHQDSLRVSSSAVDHAELTIFYGGDAADITRSVVHVTRRLHAKLEDMRVELFVAHLQTPGPDEIVVLHLQATEVQCEVAVIPDADIIITRTRDGQHRLIVTSRNRCTVLAQILPTTFFTSPSHTPTFVAPTWLIQLEGAKRKVYHYPEGFRFLSFHSSSAEKMFELGRTAVLQGVEAEMEGGLPIRQK
ncbi:uncharacterized protein C8A04DRAFT_13220 [Dichotomopilus funicola]|uniref:Fungal N-terminal domain-containing protein n=1 Tax=Dichotomopilus funicola TaxID=1934379 RepID=A0AAN6V0B2_9PEZI|nr:hypothetical protein C8A04DRAFT_13220 [Dichotomopilus funicola]